MGWVNRLTGGKVGSTDDADHLLHRYGHKPDSNTSAPAATDLQQSSGYHYGQQQPQQHQSAYPNPQQSNHSQYYDTQYSSYQQTPQQNWGSQSAQQDPTSVPLYDGWAYDAISQQYYRPQPQPIPQSRHYDPAHSAPAGDGSMAPAAQSTGANQHTANQTVDSVGQNFGNHNPQPAFPASYAPGPSLVSNGYLSHTSPPSDYNDSLYVSATFDETPGVTPFEVALCSKQDPEKLLRGDIGQQARSAVFDLKIAAREMGKSFLEDASRYRESLKSDMRAKGYAGLTKDQRTHAEKWWSTSTNQQRLSRLISEVDQEHVSATIVSEWQKEWEKKVEEIVKGSNYITQNNHTKLATLSQQKYSSRPQDTVKDIHLIHPPAWFAEGTPVEILSTDDANEKRNKDYFWDTSVGFTFTSV
jgi:hypothetical protein